MNLKGLFALITLSLLLFVTAPVHVLSTTSVYASATSTKTCPESSGTLQNVIISQDNKYLISNWDAHSVRMWNIATSNIYATFTDSSIMSDDAIAVSPDNKYVLTASKSGKGFLWDVLTGSKIYTFEVSGLPYLVSFSNNGKAILLADYKGGHLWNIEIQTEIQSFTIGNEKTGDAQLSSDKNRLLLLTETSDSRKKAYLWEIKTGKRINTFENVDKVLMSPDGRYALIGRRDGYFLEDTKTSKQIKFANITLDNTLTFRAFSPNNKYIYAIQNQTTIVIFEAQTAKVLHRFEGKLPAPSAIFFADNKRIIFSEKPTSDGDLSSGTIFSIRDLATGSILRTLTINESTLNVQDFILSPNENYLITGRYEQRVHAWNLSSNDPQSKDYC